VLTKIATSFTSKRHVIGVPVKLTSSSVAALTLPEGKTDHVAWDESLPGFGVRLRGNSKHFIIQYRIGRQQRRESLGDIRKITLEQARTIARQRFAQVELGTDPAADRAKAAAAASAQALTLDVAVARYLDSKRDTMRPSTFNSAKRHFSVHFGPLTGRPLADIKRADIAAQLQVIVKEYGRTAASRGRSTLSSLFAWAMKEGLCEANPAASTHDPLAGVDNSRDRVLSDSELVKIWNACRPDDFGHLTKLLILTGCRRDEIGSLRWSEVDLAAGTITISGERVKNRKTHVLTLPPMALDILKSIPRRDGRDFVFGKRGGGFARWGAHLDALRRRIGDMPPWTMHDLRRTFRTGLGKLGIPSHVAELAINHVRKGVEATYDRHTYQGEIASALARWAAHVAAILEGRPASNVTPLRRA
jgi:integrase